jgi:DNA-binding NtrC family response regulator
MQNTVKTLVDALLGAKTLESAAASVLEPMIARAERALASSRYASQGKLLRAMVHLRPDDGYRGLVVLERGADRLVPVAIEARGSTASYLPSASAWRWVTEHRSPVAIDVHVARVEPMQGPAARTKHEPSGQALGRESTARLLGRSSTHLYAAPLRTPAGLAGMISLEADCRAAMGRPFVWQECNDGLSLLANIAAPYLASLPFASEQAPELDDLLPVAGATMRGLIKMARVFAQQEETLLVGGPTGAGKSRLARWCHAQSRRRGGPFEHIDLLSIPDELQMGELFGWKKGAFSGAVTDNPGAVARAKGGTLFIDEIDKLSLKAQAGLLHVIEERHYRLLGEASGERKADVRFLVGTNANLESAVKAGQFREDLYYRINVLPLRLPPLDERRDEIAPWAEYMLIRRHRENAPDGRTAIARAALDVLESRRWPGNLRQLDNVIRRAYAIALIDRAGDPRELSIEERHVERALGYERLESTDSLPALLARTADAFVREAERRAEKGETLDLDHSEALRGCVLGTAARKLGSPEAAFRLLGKGATVDHRNHRKIFRREMEKLSAFYRALGQDGSTPFEDLTEDEKG